MSSFKSTKSQRGQATVEFALTALIFFTVFLAIVEFSHLFYTKLTLQYALREAGRYAVTGRTEDGINRDQAILDVFCKNLIGTGLSCPTALPDERFGLTCIPEACTALAGGAGQTVIVTAKFDDENAKPLFTGLFSFLPGFSDGKVSFEASTTWKNEPF